MLSIHCLLYCTLPLLSLCSSGDGRPRTTHAGAPDVGREDGQRALLLEAVKKGILSSLGMEREPTLTEKASDEELRKMYRLYREKTRELRGNSSLPMRETRYSATSIVLFPATVEGGVLWRRNHAGQQLQRFRAVFKKNPTIQTELTLARAELKISRQILEKPTSALPEVGQEIRVKVNGKKPINSAWTHIDAPVHGNVSSSQDLTFDISPEVDKWRKNNGRPSLVVDVAVVMGKRGVVGANPTFSMEVTLTQPEPAGRKRLPRSDKEDDCDERGWCCRKTVSVSFKDIGWSDWVVAPAEYSMHFCDGSCPHNYKPASMHTQVKSRLSQMSRGVMPRPCCVPSAYEGMVLMHYDSKGRLKLTPFNDLIVSKCHCA